MLSLNKKIPIRLGNAVFEAEAYDPPLMAGSINGVPTLHGTFYAKNAYWSGDGAVAHHGIPALQGTIIQETQEEGDSFDFLGNDLQPTINTLSYPYVISDTVVMVGGVYAYVDPGDLHTKSKWQHSVEQVWEAESPSVGSFSNDGHRLAGNIRRVIPDVASFETDCPGKFCQNWKYAQSMRLWHLVQHLNDTEEWSREEIADWLEELAEREGIDLSFPTPEEIPKEPGEE